MYSISFIFLSISVSGPLTYSDLVLLHSYYPRISLDKHLGDPFYFSFRIELLFSWSTTFSNFTRKDTWQVNFLRPCWSENVFFPSTCILGIEFLVENNFPSELWGYFILAFCLLVLLLRSQNTMILILYMKSLFSLFGSL